jgi:excinuclease UvrABC nuclease subunit
VYLHRERDGGGVMYVGKGAPERAAMLEQRTRPHAEWIVSRWRDSDGPFGYIEFFHCDDERHARRLERQLIAKFQPFFNVE